MNILFLLPPPISESGGQRTILRHINHLASLGNQVSVVVDGRRKKNTKGNNKEAFESWFGPLNAEFLNSTSKWKGDVVVATSWWTAFTALDINSESKCYFVQDIEDRFYSAGSVSVQVVASYSLGFPTVTIGEWLMGQVSGNSSLVGFTPFGVDDTVYSRLGPETRHQRKVIVLEQPDKSRRCTELLIDTVYELLELDNSIEIYSFGSDFSLLKGLGVKHLGLLPERELASLYRSATVGVSFSATNPSRIPFEMVSCGLPVVDLCLPGTSIDYRKLPISRAFPRSDLIAQEISKWISGENIFEIQSGIASIESELDAFSDFVERVALAKEIQRYSVPKREKPSVSKNVEIAAGFSWLVLVFDWIWQRTPLTVKIAIKKALVT